MLPEAKLCYNPKADRFMNWEIQLKDVCPDCNNNYLSKVDSYAKHFLETNRVEKMITEERAIRLTYDFSWLSRVLLKITFNCMRFKGESVPWIESLRNYILYGSDFPDDLHLKIGVEVVPCHRITEKERRSLTREYKHLKYLYPHMIRMGQARGISHSQVFVRYVFINNFYFYCLIYGRMASPEDLKIAIKALRSACPAIAFLHPFKKAVMVRVSVHTILDSYTPTGMMLADKWMEYLNQKDLPNQRLQPIADRSGSG